MHGRELPTAWRPRSSNFRSLLRGTQAVKSVLIRRRRRVGTGRARHIREWTDNILRYLQDGSRSPAQRQAAAPGTFDGQAIRRDQQIERGAQLLSERLHLGRGERPVPDGHVIDGSRGKGTASASPRADGQSGGGVIVHRATAAGAFQKSIHVKLAVGLRERHADVPPCIVPHEGTAGDRGRRGRGMTPLHCSPNRDWHC